MKVPTQMLREEITVEPFAGSAAYGPLFGTAVTLKARVEGRRRTVKTSDGNDVISSATAIIRPDVEVLPESKVTWRGRVYEVLDVLPMEGLTAPVGFELLLGAA